MRLGIFGGTFDPPHIGHLVLASEALDQLNLDHVLWVLTLNPPHKLDQDLTPLEYRLEMVCAAIGTDPSFEFSRVEIDRPPPHFAVDTMHFLGNQYPGAELIYLMGSDSLENLHLWHKPIEFVEQCHGIGVMRRPGVSFDMASLEAKIPDIKSKIWFIDTSLIGISASEIRTRISENRPYRYYLPPSVFKIIEDLKLYRKHGPKEHTERPRMQAPDREKRSP